MKGGRIRNHDLSQLVNEAREQGFDVGRTAKNHIKFVAPTGKICVTSGTPSDHRAVMNARSKLRRLGFNDRRDH